MRRLILFFVLAGLVGGGWFVLNQHPEYIDQAKGVFTAFSGAPLRAFKVRYTADMVMEKKRGEFLKEKGSAFLEPKQIFYPHLLMDVKYAKGESSCEGSLVWGLIDAEMVLDVSRWEKTHGFEDCLIAKIEENDFAVLKIVAENGGSISKEKLYPFFKGQAKEADLSIVNCRAKKLLVEAGGLLRLHFQNPKLEIEPHTELDAWVVSQSKKSAEIAKQKYSSSQIEKFTHLAFGQNFAIKRSQIIYLPIHVIEVQNADGTILTTYWNGLNGKRVDENLREIL